MDDQNSHITDNSDNYLGESDPKNRPLAVADTRLISFVIPVFNEAGGLMQFYRQFCSWLQDNEISNFEFIFVNDGSTDGSLAILQSIAASDPKVTAIQLSRNFGKEIALTAGLDQAKGDAVIPIDADLQHPFEVIASFLKKWDEGFDVVYAVQIRRQQGFIRKFLSRVFYRIMARLGNGVELPKGAGDFRLMSRRAVDLLLQMREKHRVMKGLYCLVGLPQTSVEFEANQRLEGETKWSLLSLLNLSIDALTSFSTAPLRVATVCGCVTGLASIGYAFLTIARTIMFGDPVAGYPTLISVVLFLGSVQLLCLGIIGEYLGRVFNETKNRPLYFVEDIYSIKADARTETKASKNQPDSQLQQRRIA